ncbi:hypothetical protein [Rubinisphaera margarita]|uniref:hypothetical protein n=1 Tax=Rubinisphaera margarita TaxID=2909586 RepID=UPI001EE81917|nr:hypothetical protein [Rubinisphaera margarita]MCG6154295.1 hypothetical protein [Rubinisphaera margarita]
MKPQIPENDQTDQIPRWQLSKRSPMLIASLCTFGLFWLCGAGYSHRLSYSEFRSIKREIADLPQEERNRLERNLARYQKLSPAEQQRYWELHNYVEQQQLEPLVDGYIEWLQSLNPFERERLRNSPEPAAQIAVVEAILRESRQKDVQLLPELISRMLDRNDRRMSSLLWMLDPSRSVNNTTPYLMTEEQLNKIIDEILFDQLGTAQRDQIEQTKATGIKKKFHILSASLANTHDAPANWPPEQTMRIVRQEGFEFQPSPEQNDRAWSPSTAVYERIAFRSLLIRSLLVSEMNSFAQKDQVSNNELQSFFARLEPNKQAALLDSPADYQAEALKWLYLWDAHQNESVFTNGVFVQSVLWEMRPSFSGFRRGGSSEGRGPDGRGSDDRRPGDRRPDDRPGPPPFNGPNGNPPDRPEPLPPRE